MPEKKTSLLLKALQAACVYTATHLWTLQMVRVLPLKEDFKRWHSPFLSLSIASNIDVCMMSINTFKLAVRDQRCVTHSFLSLFAVFEMTHFICNGHMRIWV